MAAGQSVTRGAVHVAVQDFALEPDEMRMRKAAHLMVSSLAGSLSLVTCKDPLRIALTNALKAMLAGQQLVESAMLDQVISVVVADNLDLGCSFIGEARHDMLALVQGRAGLNRCASAQLGKQLKMHKP